MESMTQIKLAEQPNIMALLQTLEDNRLNKEKQEVEALVNCLDSMEEQYGKILGEMQGIREELGKMGESQTKIQLSDIMSTSSFFTTLFLDLYCLINQMVNLLSLEQPFPHKLLLLQKVLLFPKNFP